MRRKKCSCQLDISDQVEIVRSEPNVSILDLAEYAFDGGEWQPEEEILRIDNLFREKLGYPLRMEAFAQPWTNDREEGFEHTLSLRFHIHTEILLEEIFLAMENDGKTRIFLDEKAVENRAEGGIQITVSAKCRFRRWNPESMNWLWRSLIIPK